MTTYSATVPPSLSALRISPELTPGETYPIVDGDPYSNPMHSYVGSFYIDVGGVRLFCLTKGCAHLGEDDWIISDSRSLWQRVKASFTAFYQSLRS